jgi:hypothetical protein
MLLYWAQLLPEGPTIRAVLGIDDGRQFDATTGLGVVVATFEGVKTVETDDIELAVDTELDRSDDAAEEGVDKIVEYDEEVAEEDVEEEEEDDEAEDDPVCPLAALLATIALFTEESIQFVFGTATQGYTVL